MNKKIPAHIIEAVTVIVAFIGCLISASVEKWYIRFPVLGFSLIFALISNLIRRSYTNESKTLDNIRN